MRHVIIDVTMTWLKYSKDLLILQPKKQMCVKICYIHG